MDDEPITAFPYQYLLNPTFDIFSNTVTSVLAIVGSLYLESSIKAATTIMKTDEKGEKEKE